MSKGFTIENVIFALWSGLSFGLICGVILLVILLGTYLYVTDDWFYCKFTKPEFNSTSYRNGVCFTKYWDEYCKIYRPKYCKDSPVCSTDWCLREGLV